MKRIILYVALIITFTFLGYIGMTNQPVELPSESILGTTYYKYNVETGEYDNIVFTKDAINYKGTEISLDGCSSYTYQESTGIIKMGCGRAFRLITPSENLIVLNIDNNNYYFYKTREESYAKEFQNKFGMTLSDYEFEGNEKLNNITIDVNTYSELISSDIESYIYVKTENCTNECIILSNSVTDLSGNKNVYFIEYNSLTEEIKEQIKEKDSEFNSSTSPKILVVGNDRIIDIITLQVNNFDTNIFIGYLDDYKTNNEVVANEEN